MAAGEFSEQSLNDALAAAKAAYDQVNVLYSFILKRLSHPRRIPKRLRDAGTDGTDAGTDGWTEDDDDDGDGTYTTGRTDD